MTDNSAMDAERRRIERALHDGVQQDLIAVAVRLQLARHLAVSDLPAALELLDEIGRDVHDALDRVRVLANEIYPSLLEAGGLAEALRGAASAAGIPARIEADGLGRHTWEIEAAAYFCCRSAFESLAADAASPPLTIRLQDEPDALRLELTRAGAGFDGDALASARDRIEGLGGLLTIESEPGRETRITATLPLQDELSAR